MARLTLVVGGSSTAILLGRGDGTFHSMGNIGCGTGNTILADLNGDGNLDIAAADLDAQALVAGDFNGDGKLDLVAVVSSSSSALAILLGNGDGTFRPSKASVPRADTTTVFRPAILMETECST